MNGFGLILGHLLGDYILQNDWQAKNKTNQAVACNVIHPFGTLYFRWLGHLACFVHCSLYTLAVFTCSFWWLPAWAYVVVFAAHYPVDRWRLARKWMSISGQEAFATGPLSPWSIIVVDNTIHLAVLFVLGMVA